MKSEISYKKVLEGDLEGLIKKVTEALGTVSFGVLARHDIHAKIKEKLGKDISPIVILSICNPKFALEMLSINTDVSALMPCNAVIREVGKGKYSIEFAKAAELAKCLDDNRLTNGASQVDEVLKKAFDLL